MYSQALHVLCLPIKVCIVKLIWYPFLYYISTEKYVQVCLILSWFSFFERLIIIYQKEEEEEEVEEDVLLLYKIDDKRGDDLTYQNLWNFQDEKFDNFGKKMLYI